jgi:hypothetical protein
VSSSLLASLAGVQSNVEIELGESRGELLSENVAFFSENGRLLQIKEKHFFYILQYYFCHKSSGI